MKYCFETENQFSFDLQIPKHISKCVSGARKHTSNLTVAYIQANANKDGIVY